MMRKKKYIMALIFCLAHVFLYAQANINVGAIIETESHLWILKSISRYNDSLAVNWEIKSKKPNTKAKINSENISLIDYHTNTKHKTLYPLLKTEFEIVEAFDTESFRTIFPAIKDSTSLISVCLSSTLSVDSIILPPSNMSLIGWVKYKVPLCNKILRTRNDSVSYSDSLFQSGMNMYKMKQYQKAIICFEKCYAFDRLLDFEFLPLLYRSTRHYYDYSRVWLAHCYYLAGWEEKAKSLDEDHIFEPYDRKLVETSDSIYNVIHNYLYKPPSEDKHILENIKICQYDSISLGVSNQRYAYSLYDLGRTYSSYRKFANAKTVLNRSYDIMVHLSKENWLVHSILDELAKIAYEEENYLSAIRYKEQSMGITNGHLDFSKESILSTNYSTLAYYYSKAGDWEKALNILKNRMLYWKTKDHNDFSNSIHYTSSLSSYASLLSESGRYKDALRVYSQLPNPDLSTLGIYYYDIRDYQNALNCYLEVLKDSSSFSLFDCQNSIAICYSALGDNEKAIRVQKKSIAKTNPNLLTYSNLYVESYTTRLSNLASFFNRNEQYDSALVYEKKSLELKKQYFSPNSVEIAYSFMNIGIALGGKGKWREAIENLTFSYEIYKKQQQRKLYQRTLSYLARFSFCLHKYDELNSYISELSQSASEDLLSTFQELTYDERSRYIDEYSNLLNSQIPQYAYYTDSDSLKAAAYNATLVIKGALLSSENGVKRVIEDSRDASLMDLWEELRADRYILSKCIEKDSMGTKHNIDSLQRVINKMEDSLIVRCKEYGDITQSMKLKWQDVQRSFHPEDIAIEFLSFPINNDSVMYVALALRKESESPKMITLFEEKQLKDVSDTLYYQCEEMTDLVWGPLLSELKGIKNIYFSPTGILYNIGIEYLPGMENYNIFRISSTRELVTNRQKSETGKNAVLYGGLDYYAGLTERQNSSAKHEVFVEHANVRGMGLRGGKEPLPQTKVEVEIIGEELKKNQWTYNLLMGTDGTEESFKALSGKKVNCLHVSTHGFYYTPEDVEDTGYDFLQLNNEMASAEDKSLTRSGLIMSGANHILEGEPLPDNVEDGILTAKEIADVDLRGLDLVVLSACQTGLGDISQGEGVFGLQRGFKKAGANTILMSLWKVDDEATQILMTQFYKNLLSGQSKRQSLFSAQKHLREYDGGRYNAPKYWAAFIMLDGIE